MRPCLTAAEVADLCFTTEQHIRKLARERQIPHFRIGGLVKFDPDEVQRFLAAAHVVPRNGEASRVG